MGSPAPRVGNPDPKVGKGTWLRVQEDCGPGTEKRRRRIGEDILLGSLSSAHLPQFPVAVRAVVWLPARKGMIPGTEHRVKIRALHSH